MDWELWRCKKKEGDTGGGEKIEGGIEEIKELQRGKDLRLKISF